MHSRRKKAISKELPLFGLSPTSHLLQKRPSALSLQQRSADRHSVSFRVAWSDQLYILWLGYFGSPRAGQGSLCSCTLVTTWCRRWKCHQLYQREWVSRQGHIRRSLHLGRGRWNRRESALTLLPPALQHHVISLGSIPYTQYLSRLILWIAIPNVYQARDLQWSQLGIYHTTGL